jgi:hypothetical protein
LTDILFIDVPITWEDGFDTGDGIRMVKFGFIEGRRGDGIAGLHHHCLNHVLCFYQIREIMGTDSYEKGERE